MVLRLTCTRGVGPSIVKILKWQEAVSPRGRGNRVLVKDSDCLVRSIPAEHGESHTFQYTIDLSPPPKKKKTKPARKAKVTKPPKPKVTKAKPKVKKPPKQRTRITPEERAQRRRAYEQARSQLPHRRERNRVEAKERHRQAKELGLCRTGPSPAMPGQTRCQDCIEKRRPQRIQAKEKATQQRHGALDQPLLF